MNAPAGRRGLGPPCDYCSTMIDQEIRCRAVPRANQPAHPSLTRYLRTLKQLEMSSDDDAIISWLDLGSGDGRWLKRLINSKPKPEYLSSVRFTLLDFDRSKLDSCERRIRTLVGDNAQVDKVQGDLNEPEALEEKLRDVPGFPFDHVSMINCLHELDPYRVPDLLLSLIRCTRPGRGSIHIADHDPLEEIELGALPWPQAFTSEFLAFIAERHEGLLPERNLERMLKTIDRRKPPAIHVVWRRSAESPENPSVDAPALRKWIREKLPAFQSAAEEYLLGTWNAHLLIPNKAGPTDEEQKEIVTEFMRLVGSHFYLAHRIQEN